MKHQMRFEGDEKGTREKKCTKLTQVFILLAVIGSMFIAGCITPEPEKPAGNLSVANLLEDPVYDTEVAIYGQVNLLGELFCPCVELRSGGETVQVWYGLMVEDDGTERPAVSVEGIENGDWVIVTGELKTAGAHRSLNDFWARTIEKIENLEDFGISPSPEFTGVTEAESKEIARAFVENSSTYQFDGFDLAYNQTTVLRCPYCWIFAFDFASRHAGYGDRTGQVLAQVITPHTAEVTVINGTITSAVLDGQWDMLTQTPVSDYVNPAEAQGGFEPLTLEEARAIAENSTCVQEGTLTDTYVYNEYTRTWWIDLDPFVTQEGCNPACVVYEDTRTADINWRCTGLLLPE
jgi:hypothetical protein